MAIAKKNQFCSPMYSVLQSCLDVTIEAWFCFQTFLLCQSSFYLPRVFLVVNVFAPSCVAFHISKVKLCQVFVQHLLFSGDPADSLSRPVLLYFFFGSTEMIFDILNFFFHGFFQLTNLATIKSRNVLPVSSKPLEVLSFI